MRSGILSLFVSATLIAQQPPPVSVPKVSTEKNPPAVVSGTLHTITWDSDIPGLMFVNPDCAGCSTYLPILTSPDQAAGCTVTAPAAAAGKIGCRQLEKQHLGLSGTQNQVLKLSSGGVPTWETTYLHKGNTDITGFSTNETDLFGTAGSGISVPAGHMDQAGSQINMRLRGTLSSNSSTTLTVKIYYGASALYHAVTATLSNSSNTTQWFLDCDLYAIAADSQYGMCRITIGNYSATGVTTGQGGLQSGNLLNHSFGFTGAVDSGAAQNLRATFTFSAANTSHSYVSLITYER